MAKGIKTGGRVQGTPNKITKDLRKRIEEIVIGNIDKVNKDIQKLTPKDRIKAITELFQYIIPKYQSLKVEQDINQNPVEFKIEVLSTETKDLIESGNFFPKKNEGTEKKD